MIASCRKCRFVKTRHHRYRYVLERRCHRSRPSEMATHGQILARTCAKLITSIQVYITFPQKSSSSCRGTCSSVCELGPEIATGCKRSCILTSLFQGTCGSICLAPRGLVKTSLHGSFGVQARRTARFGANFMLLCIGALI